MLSTSGIGSQHGGLRCLAIRCMALLTIAYQGHPYSMVPGWAIESGTCIQQHWRSALQSLQGQASTWTPASPSSAELRRPLPSFCRLLLTAFTLGRGATSMASVPPRVLVSRAADHNGWTVYGLGECMPGYEHVHRLGQSTSAGCGLEHALVPWQ